MALDFSKASGNELLKKAKARTDEALNSEKIVMISMDLIDPNPDNVKIFNMEHIDALADTIKEEGFTGAIEVFALPNGRYEISSGHRRYEANKLLKNKTIPCVILHDVDEVAKARRLITSNINNRDLTPIDRARAIEYYIEHVIKPVGKQPHFIDECARVFHMSKPQIKRLRALLKYTPDIQDLIATGKIPYAALDGSRTFSEEEQNELYNRLLEELKLSDDESIGIARVRQIINNIHPKDITHTKGREIKKIKVTSPQVNLPSDETMVSTRERGEYSAIPQRALNNTLPIAADDDYSIGEERASYAEDELSNSLEALIRAFNRGIKNKKQAASIIGQLKMYIEEFEQKNLKK